jgi:hypothetical protein
MDKKQLKEKLDSIKKEYDKYAKQLQEIEDPELRKELEQLKPGDIIDIGCELVEFVGFSNDMIHYNHKCGCHMHRYNGKVEEACE